MSVTDVARAFGLSTDPSCYHEVVESTARAIAVHVLNRDLAYHGEVIPTDDALERRRGRVGAPALALRAAA